MKLRYYGDSSMEADHRAVVDLLTTVNREWGIPVAVERVRDRHGPIDDFPGRVRDGDVEDAYARDFVANPVLAANVGHDPEEAFATDNGLPTITGCVGIVEADETGGFLLWATLLSGDPPGQELFSTDAYTLGFLEEVLAEGPDVLEEKCASAEDVTPPAHLAGDGEVPDDLAVSNGVIDEGTRRELSEIIRSDGRGPTVERPTGDAGRPDGARTDPNGHRSDATSRNDADGTSRADADPTGVGSTADGTDDADGDTDPVDVDGLEGIDARGRTDEDLLAEFVASAPAMSGVDQGDVELAVTVGSVENPQAMPTGERSVAREFGTRTADAVIRGDRHWVVQTASRLSARELDQSLGEVLVAERLYRRARGLNEDETRPVLLFDALGRTPGDVEDTVELLSEVVEYAGAMGVGLFVRDPSIAGGLFRRLTDYGSTPASVSMDSIAR